MVLWVRVSVLARLALGRLGAGAGERGVATTEVAILVAVAAVGALMFRNTLQDVVSGWLDRIPQP